jgi:hypothetical protein
MAQKSDRAEVEKRVNEVYSLILAAHSREKICQYALKKWNITYSQADRYIKKARARMSEVFALQREEALAEELELRRYIINKTLESNGFKLTLQAADSRAKLRGLFMPLSMAIDTVAAHGFQIIDPTE